MNRIIPFMTAALLVLVLAACGDSSTGETQSSFDVSTKEQGITIAETVLLDEAGVKITAKELREEGYFGPEILLLIENNSSKDLAFQCRDSSINGYMAKGMLFANVPAGENVETTLSFNNHDLSICKIKTIGDMEFSFHIYDSNTGEVYLDTPQIELKTSAGYIYNKVYDDRGKIAYNQNGVKIVVEELREDHSTLGPSIVISIENNSDRDIIVRPADTLLNSIKANGRSSTEVIAGKRAVDTIAFLTTELEEVGITKIKTADLSFRIIDADTWEIVITTDVSAFEF